MKILEATREDDQAIVDLYKKYGFALQYQDWFNWKYYSNPAGEAMRFKILYRGRIVGAVAVIPQLFSYRGHKIMGLQAVDGLLGVEVRGKGNFNYLMEFLTTRRMPGSFEYSFYFGFASLPPSVKALVNAGWKKIETFDLFTCIVLPEPLLSKLKLPVLQKVFKVPWAAYRKWMMGNDDENVLILPSNGNQIDFDQFRDSEKVGGIRSQAYMNWRTDNNPLYKICTLLIYDDDILAGYAVCKIVGHAVEIIELRLKNPSKAQIQGLIRYIYKEGIGSTIDFWRIESSKIRRVMNSLGFIRRNSNVGFFVNNTGKLSLPTDPLKWKISYLDSDW